MVSSQLKREGGGHGGDREVVDGQEAEGKMVKLEVEKMWNICHKPYDSGQ